MSNSPFKFLNAFEKQDRDFFFGREEETEELYEMTYDTRLMLLYGASGTGKTSLIQCGLANKFKETRWKDIFIRREQNINDSIEKVLKSEVQLSGAYALGKAENEVERLELLYKVMFKPIYLIFDQFEELFIIDASEEEQEKFFNFIKDLLQSKVAVKVILIMREEFIAQLSNFEKTIPTLFDHRYRIEPMRYSKGEEVIEKTLDKLAENQEIIVQNPPQIAAGILNKLTGGKQKLELTYLQVYLDRLYQDALKSQSEKPVFTPELVEDTGNFEDIIGEFLRDQLENMEGQLGKGKKGIPIKILSALITDEHTKKVLKEEDLEQIRIQLAIEKTDFEWCIDAFENMRILKRYD